MPIEQRRYLLSTLLLTAAAFLSRFLGLIRSTLLGALFGATGGSGLADAYTAAFRIPDIVYTLVLSGLTSIILVPYFLKRRDRREDLNRAVSGFVNAMAVGIVSVMGLLYVLMPALVRGWLLRGWADEHLLDTAVRLSRILLLQMGLLGLSSVFGSLLNALERYPAYALAMVSYNGGALVGLIVFSPMWGIDGVAWGVVLGSAAHLSLQLAGSLKAGWRWRPCWLQPSRELGELTLNALPRSGAMTLEQVSRLFLVGLGSYLSLGSLLIYDNAENLALIAYGLIATSLATTAFPQFLSAWDRGDWSTLDRLLGERLRLLALFTVPAVIGGGVLRLEASDILLGWRRFTAADVALTADTLLYLTPGAFFFGVFLLLTRFFYAVRRSWTPLIASTSGLFSTWAAGALALGGLQVAGLGLGRSVGWIVQTLLLVAFLLVDRRLGEGLKRGLRDSVLILLLGLASGVLAELVRGLSFLAGTEKLASLLRAVLAGLVFLLAYALGCFALGFPEVRAALAYLRGSRR